MIEIFKLENPHWEGSLYSYPERRIIYKELESSLKNNMILSIEGPRRVGKTVLMKQLINHLIENKTNSKDILYHSFDNYSQDPIKVFLEYEKVRGSSLRDGKVYLFLDELQKVNDWQTYIKTIFDNYQNVKIVISGSSLRQSKKESLAGRIFEFFVSPLSFGEYLVFADKKNLLNVEINDVLLTEYNVYLFRQYPDLALNKDYGTRTYVGDLISKIIFEDSGKYIPNVDKDLLHKIFNIILRNPGQIVEYSDLAKDLGTERRIVSDYIEFLISSSLIRKVYNFSTNPRKIETRARKIYPFCTTLIKYVDENPEMSKVVETDVAFQTNAEFFWKERNEEIDFILNSDKKIAVEVKYRNTVDNKDIKTFFTQNFEKLKVTKKYLIVKNVARTNSLNKDIISIPYYLLWKTVL
ncbi:MAG: hypothetical protein COT55_00055 [Candidatus Diapherotrites archaeon CG09_land_8_20_14_0_10_32_12]|nr:MAG: hypothetical protein COT55_00055 [Candidatus Diapherotrites archaeon CG09_land_8_20_14_0_10_32_12]